MDDKTVMLDEDAHFEVSKEHLREPRPGTAGYLLRNAERYALSEETLDAIEEQIQARSQSPARAVKL